MPKAMTRQPEVLLILGRNGTGKTTLARTLVANVEASALCVISPSGEWGSWNQEPEGIVASAIQRGARALVLDDCDAYLTGVESGFWRRLLSTNRHLGLDILLLSRRPQELPRWAIAAATRLYVFQLGPRERAWVSRVYGVEPSTEPHAPVAIAV
jgi:ABC-type sugar transport system ATPase subunit